MSGRSRSVMDEQLIRREYYNHNKFDVRFTRMDDMIPYIQAAGITIGTKYYVLKAGEFIVLPHAYYIVAPIDATEEQFTLVTNYGDAIGKGNTLPSLPEVSVNKFH